MNGKQTRLELVWTPNVVRLLGIISKFKVNNKIKRISSINLLLSATNCEHVYERGLNVRGQPWRVPIDQHRMPSMQICAGFSGTDTSADDSW